MFTKQISLLTAGMAIAFLLSTSVYAAAISLGDDAMAEITGSANDTAFSNNPGVNVSLPGNSNSNGLLAGNLWSNDLTTENSQNFIASNQSGAASQVQQNINGLNNALTVGSVSQNAVVNSGGTIGGGLNVVGYAVVARSDF